MRFVLLLPHDKLLTWEGVEQDAEARRMTIAVRCTSSSATCPDCQVRSERVHSRYVRHLGDLPWQGWQVLLKLPDRDASAVAAWLHDRPHIDWIARDRGDVYRKGATAGAPQATQVADRFHLVMNLRDAFARFLEGRRSEIKSAFDGVLPPPLAPAGRADPPRCQGCRSATRGWQDSESRRRRAERYEAVKTLHAAGKSERRIAQELNIHREMVGRYLRAESFPERAQGGRRSRPAAGRRTSPSD